MEQGRDYLVLLGLVGAGVAVLMRSQQPSRPALGGYTTPGAVTATFQEGPVAFAGQQALGVAPVVGDPVPPYTGPAIVPDGRLGNLDIAAPPPAWGPNI